MNEYLKLLKRSHDQVQKEFPTLTRCAVGLIIQRQQNQHQISIEPDKECRVWKEYFDWVCDPYFDFVNGRNNRLAETDNKA